MPGGIFGIIIIVVFIIIIIIFGIIIIVVFIIIIIFGIIISLSLNLPEEEEGGGGGSTSTMTTRCRLHGACRPRAIRFWRMRRVPSSKDVMRARALLRDLRDLARAYVKALLRHCARTVRSVEGGRRAAFLAFAVHPGMVSIPAASPQQLLASGS